MNKKPKKKPLPGWKLSAPTPTNYYVLECYRKEGEIGILEEPDLPAEIDNWMGGTPLAIPKDAPLVFIVEPEDDETALLPFYDSAVPLMRSDMVAALIAAGVNNLDVYPAMIKDLVSSKEYTDYRAVNIIGAIKALNTEASKGTSLGFGDAKFFDSLVLDEDKIAGKLFFRLSESLSAIIVHQSVRDHLIKAGFDRLDFIHPEEYSG